MCLHRRLINKGCSPGASEMACRGLSKEVILIIEHISSFIADIGHQAVFFVILVDNSGCSKHQTPFRETLHLECDIPPF